MDVKVIVQVTLRETPYGGHHHGSSDRTLTPPQSIQVVKCLAQVQVSMYTDTRSTDRGYSVCSSCGGDAASGGKQQAGTG